MYCKSDFSSRDCLFENLHSSFGPVPNVFMAQQYIKNLLHKSCSCNVLHVVLFLPIVTLCFSKTFFVSQGIPIIK